MIGAGARSLRTAGPIGRLLCVRLPRASCGLTKMGNALGLGIGSVALVTALAIAAASAAAQTPETSSREAAELAAELTGRSVYTIDGVEVGSIAEVLFDDDGVPQKLRVRTAANLGLGERLVELPRGSFMLLRGAAVLDLTADEVPSIPEVSTKEQR